MSQHTRVSAAVRAAYDAQYDEDMAAWRALGAKFKARNIREVCAGHRFGSVLECGAGDGSLLLQLARAGFCPELHAAEISRSGVAVIGRRDIPGLRSVARFDGYHLPYPDKRFDLAVLSHVLEHVEHPRLLLRELARVSRFQVIEVPLDYSPAVDTRVGHFLAYGHINIFTPALLRFLLLSEGFAILRDRYDPGHGEVDRFQRYRLQGRPRTLRAEARRRAVAGLVALRRRLTPAAQRRERRFNAYCVLCEHGGGELSVLPST